MIRLRLPRPAAIALAFQICFFSAADALAANAPSPSVLDLLARRAETQAMAATTAILAQGATPGAWPARVFVPEATIAAATRLFVGLVLSIPIGQPDAAQRVDGYVDFTIVAATAMRESGRLGAHLQLAAKYMPDRKPSPWGTDATSFSADVLLFIVGQELDQKTASMSTLVRIVPTSIDVKEGSFAARLMAGTFLAKLLNTPAADLERVLTVRLPGLIQEPAVDLSFESTSAQPFDEGGGTSVTARMQRTPQVLRLVLDRFLVAQSGLWLLGELPPAEITPVSVQPVPTDDELRAQRAALAVKLAPFERRAVEVELGMSAALLTHYADRLLSRGPVVIDVTTSRSSGTIASVVPIRDNILGDIGYSLSPDGDAFAHGSIVATAGAASWSSGAGVSIPAAAAAKADMKLTLHVKAGRVSEEITHAVKLVGDGAAEAALALAFERRATPGGSALLVQPRVECTRTTINVESGPEIVGAWYVMSPIGLRIEQGIGGGKIAPAYLADSLPIVVESPFAEDNHGQVITREPDRAVLRPAHKFIQLRFTPVAATADNDGIELRSDLEVAPRAEAESAAEKSARDALHSEIAAAGPDESCDAGREISVTGGGIAVINVSREVKFLVDSASRKVAISQDAWKAVKDLTGGDPDQLMKLPQEVFTDNLEDIKHGLEFGANAANEIGKGLGNAADTIARGAADTGNSIGEGLGDAAGAVGKGADDTRDAIKKGLKALNPF